MTWNIQIKSCTVTATHKVESSVVLVKLTTSVVFRNPPAEKSRDDGVAIDKHGMRVECNNGATKEYSKISNWIVFVSKEARDGRFGSNFHLEDDKELATHLPKVAGQ